MNSKPCMRRSPWGKMCELPEGHDGPHEAQATSSRWSGDSPGWVGKTVREKELEIENGRLRDALITAMGSLHLILVGPLEPQVEAALKTIEDALGVAPQRPGPPKPPMRSMNPENL